VFPRLCTGAALAAAAVVLLTGCGAVPDLNPGVAVRVDDDAVSTRDLEDLAVDYCSALAAGEQAGGAVPNHFVYGLSASSLGLRSAATQLMAEHDVTVDASYDKTVEQAKTEQLASLDEAQRDAVIEVGAASIYVSAAETSVGRKVLGGTPSDEDALAAGQKALVAWIDDHDVRVDPKYGVSIATGTAVLSDTSVSYSISDVAKAGQAEQPDNAAAAALPESQRCG
jgi:peptidyl-prolyl cis-trans isomerase SurA